MNFTELWLPCLIVMMGFYWSVELWVEHKEKVSDAIQENIALKKELETLKSQITLSKKK